MDWTKPWPGSDPSQWASAAAGRRAIGGAAAEEIGLVREHQRGQVARLLGQDRVEGGAGAGIVAAGPGLAPRPDAGARAASRLPVRPRAASMLVAALAAKPGWRANRKVWARSRWPITSCRVGRKSRLDLADRVAGIAQHVEQRRLVPLGRGRIAHGHRHAARIAHQHRLAPSLERHRRRPAPAPQPTTP